MKKRVKKLILSRETLQGLQRNPADPLQAVYGGNIKTFTNTRMPEDCCL